MRLSACKLHSAPEESYLKRDNRRKSCSFCRSAASERYRVLKGPDEQHQRQRSQYKQCGGNSFVGTKGFVTARRARNHTNKKINEKEWILRNMQRLADTLADLSPHLQS